MGWEIEATMKRSLLIILALAAAVVGFRFRDEAGRSLSAWLAPSKPESIPTLMLRRSDYRVEISAQGELTGFQSTPAITPRVPGSLRIAWIIEEGAIVEPGDVLVRFDNADAQLSLDQNQNEVDRFQAQIEKSDLDVQAQLRAFQLDGEAARLELDFSQGQIRKDEEIFSRWEIQESVMSAALARFKTLSVEEKEKLQQKLSRADLEILGIDRRRAVGEVELARSKLAAMEVAAPTAGVVLYRRNTYSAIQVGGEAYSGQALLDVADTNRFEGSLFIVESAVAGIEAGKTAVCFLDAFPGQTFPAVVRQVSAVSQQISRKDPQKYFECRVSLQAPPETLVRLKPGMRMTGRILVEDLKEALVVPKNAVFKEKGRFLVYAVEGEDYRERPVEILRSDHGFYVIEGVEEGIRLCLRHPLQKERLRLPDFNAPPAGSQNRRFVGS